MIPGSLVGLLTATEQVAENGLVLNLDAGNSSSYPGSGNTWFDLSSSNEDGVLKNGVSYASADGGSLSFDGNNDFVQFGTSGGTLLNSLSELTLEVWFKADGTNNDRGLIRPDSNSDTDSGFSLRYDASGFSGGGTRLIKASFGTEDNENASTTLESSSFIQTSGIWTCIAVTCDVGTSIALYKNGVLDTPTDVSIGGSTVSGCNNLFIGRGPTIPFSGSEYWDGNISIVRIYNRLLTAGEITGNYNAVKQRYGL